MNQPVNQEPQASPLTRKMRVSEIEDDVATTWSVTEADRAAIANLLDLVALDSLSIDYRLRRGRGGRFHLSGRLTAEATQSCVVTLEPVPASVDLPLELEFWPAVLIKDLEKKAEDPNHPSLTDWPEAITNDTLDLGPVVYESFATALDPYPKKQGASFQWSQGDSEAQDRESSPFAALKKLKKP